MGSRGSRGRATVFVLCRISALAFGRLHLTMRRRVVSGGDGAHKRPIHFLFQERPLLESHQEESGRERVINSQVPQFAFHEPQIGQALEMPAYKCSGRMEHTHKAATQPSSRTFCTLSLSLGASQERILQNRKCQVFKPDVVLEQQRPSARNELVKRGP